MRNATTGFYDVYILVREGDGRVRYSGLTRDLNTRLAEHNRGKCPHTSKQHHHSLSPSKSLQNSSEIGLFVVAENEQSDLVEHSMESRNVVWFPPRARYVDALVCFPIL